MKFVYSWLEWVVCEIGVKRFILAYAVAFLLVLICSAYAQSFALVFTSFVVFSVVAVSCLLAFSHELAALTHLLNHIGKDAEKHEALVASRGLMSSIKAPLLDLVRESSRKNTEFADAMKEISYSSNELSKNANTLSSNTSHQSDSTVSSAAAVTEIGQSIEDVTSRIKQVLDLAGQTQRLGDQGSESIDLAKAAIEKVSDLAKQTQSNVEEVFLLLQMKYEHLQPEAKNQQPIFLKTLRK